MKIIELKDISFQYQSGSENFSLDDINLPVKKGDYTSLMGPNGSGKSTLLKLISGVVQPNLGVVNLLGKNITHYSRKEIARKIAFVPQSTGNAYPFSVFEIVMMGRSPYLNLWGNEKKEDIEIVRESLNQVGIYHLREKGINEISGGEAQRAYIARAIAQKTEMILLDEPNSHLDIEHQIAIFKLLKEFNESAGTTIITISHDLNLAASFCKKGIILNQGALVKEGMIGEVLTEENIKMYFNVNSKIERHKSSFTISILAS